MSFKVKSHHPLKELLAKLLFGIETIPIKEQRKAVGRACAVAARWHDSEVETLGKWINHLECNLTANGGYCPDCYQKLVVKHDNNGHSSNCKLNNFINSIRG